MKLRLSTLTPFLLAALARGQILSSGTPSSKALAAIPRPDAPLPVVPCEGALKDEYDLYLADWPEKEYAAEVSASCMCIPQLIGTEAGWMAYIEVGAGQRE
jgi:hypothetical protein